MKAGFHGQEELEDIVVRKQEEILSAGMSLWGYGGSVCHPTRQIQPLCSLFGDRTIPVKFVLTVSRPLLAMHQTATEYSTNGNTWEKIPKTIRVTASKYALVLGQLVWDVSWLDLANFEVAVGPCEGTPLQDYFRGRVDKACARARSNEAPELASPRLRVELVGELLPPYAVFVR